MIDVSDIVADPDFVQSITLRRPNAPTLGNEGVASFTYAADVVIPAIVQPAKPSDLSALPEGIDLTEVISVWSTTPLTVGTEGGVGSDVLIIGGKFYRVIKLEDWTLNGYCRAFAQGYEPGP